MGKLNYAWLLLMCAIPMAHSEAMNYATLAAADGQTVTFRAQISTHPEQHPTGLLDRYHPQTHTVQHQHETYAILNAHDPQIVLASPEAITCKDALDITGTVRSIALGGKADTKNSYRRVWIAVSSYRCR
ncbi:MAG: hypothetical protein WAO71_12285 [Gallionella sp.]